MLMKVEKAMNLDTKPKTRPHPLQDIVLKAFEKETCLDAPKLVLYLSGSTAVSDGGTNAYCKVATDVLGYMKGQDILYTDHQGWYRLK